MRLSLRLSLRVRLRVRLRRVHKAGRELRDFHLTSSRVFFV